MFNVCSGCGEYSDDKNIDSTGSYAICKTCGHKHPFVQLPLLIVTGASGTGKTTVALQLNSKMSECVCLESDILWRDEFNKSANGFIEYRNLWLRMAKNISQAGRPVVLFGSSTPGQFEECPESRYFSKIHYLAFVCDKDKLVERLKARPDWRKSSTEDNLKRMIDFNQWFIDQSKNLAEQMTLLDTSNLTLEESVQQTSKWIKQTLKL